MTQLNTTTSLHYTSVTSVVITEDITFLSEKQRWGKVNRSMEYVSIPLKTDKSTTIGDASSVCLYSAKYSAQIGILET